MSFDRTHAILSRLLKEAARCGTCGKSTLVLVVPGRRDRKPERVSAATHCTCPGGPAQPIVGKTDADFLRTAQ